jgi:mRNA-degrading endonuclease RelE of RelBE toxin-antitoxin system
MSYAYWLSKDALKFLERLSARNRRRLIDGFERMAATPFECDYELNRKGFLTNFKRIGGWMIVYRVDVPVKCVMISDIVDAT